MIGRTKRANVTTVWSCWDEDEDEDELDMLMNDDDD